MMQDVFFRQCSGGRGPSLGKKSSAEGSAPRRPTGTSYRGQELHPDTPVLCTRSCVVERRRERERGRKKDSLATSLVFRIEQIIIRAINGFGVILSTLK